MNEMKRISPFIKERISPFIKERISPFIKNLNGENGACPAVINVADSGTLVSNRMCYGEPHYYGGGNYCMVPVVATSSMPYSMEPWLYQSQGCYEYAELEQSMMGDTGEEEKLPSDNNQCDQLTGTEGQENRMKKGEKEEKEEPARESLDEICERFMQRMFFLIQENKIEISNEKDLYKEETDRFYGHEKNGFIYLKPKKTYDFVVEDIQEEAGKHVPKSLELERYMYQKNILEREEGKKPNFRKKVTIWGKRMRCWCLKKDKMLEAMREYEEEHRDMAFDVEKSKK